MNIRHLNSIDAIRGWAIFAVIVLHVGTYFVPPAILVPVVHEGGRGVQLFFIASAFTLFLSAYNRSTEHKPILNYFIRRFFRIVPLYYAAALFWTWFHQSPFFWGSSLSPTALEVAAVLLFVNGWHPNFIHLIVPGGWSVAVEMNFYLILPVLIARVLNYRQALRVAIIVSIVGIVAGVTGYYLAPHIWMGDEVVNARGYFAGFWLPISMPAFMAGMVMYFAWREGRLQALSTPIALFSALVAMVGVCYLHVPLKNILFIPLLSIFLLAVLRLEPIFVVNLFSRYLGRISYSAYFVHFLIIDLIVHFVPSFVPETYRSFFLMLALTLVLTIAFSEITFRLVEEPGRLIGRVLIRRIDATRQPITQSVT